MIVSEVSLAGEEEREASERASHWLEGGEVGEMERREEGRRETTGEREEAQREGFEERKNRRRTAGMGRFEEREHGRRRTGHRGLQLIDALVSIFQATVRGCLGSKYFDQNIIFKWEPKCLLYSVNFFFYTK